MTETLSINLPFEGFYESRYSGEVDNIEEREAEYFEEYRQAEEGVPPELRLDGQQYCEILSRHTTYSLAYEAIARDYVESFDIAASEEIGLARGRRLGLTFEEMTSPREYNFQTDRIFARIPVATVEALFTLSKRRKHARLAEVIRERFTSYDGFLSHYSNELADWLRKPVTEWDHNELGTLLIASLPFDERGEWRDFEWRVFEIVIDDEAIYNAWSNAVDWSAVEKAIAEWRADKLEELRAENPDLPEPVYRCAETPDLFEGRAR
jgi:hypothetical protein